MDTKMKNGVEAPSIEPYIGVKLVQAFPENRLGTAADEATKAEIGDEEVEIEGYAIIYEDGYKSWSPKEVFEKAYRRTTGLTFGLAIEALKLGKKVARENWNGSNMFAVLSPGKLNLEADGFFNKDLKEHAMKIGGFMDVRPAFMLKTAQDDVAYWAPSGSDCLAEDWFIVE